MQVVNLPSSTHQQPSTDLIESVAAQAPCSEVQRSEPGATNRLKGKLYIFYPGKVIVTFPVQPGKPSIERDY
jgi:hypothetical protein